MHYDTYNREERAACAHLFRLLHEGLADEAASSPLADMLETVTPELEFHDGAPSLRHATGTVKWSAAP